MPMIAVLPEGEQAGETVPEAHDQEHGYRCKQGQAIQSGLPIRHRVHRNIMRRVSAQRVRQRRQHKADHQEKVSPTVRDSSVQE